MAARNDLNGLIRFGSHPSKAIKAIIYLGQIRGNKKKTHATAHKAHTCDRAGKKSLIIQAAASQQPREQRVILPTMGNEGLFGTKG